MEWRDEDGFSLWEYNLEGQLVRSALGHLLVTCDVSKSCLWKDCQRGGHKWDG